MSEPQGDPNQASVQLDLMAARVKELEQELVNHSREHQFLLERYQRLLETITDYVYSVQIKDGRVVETQHSPACVAVTGYSSVEFADDPMLWIQMVHPSDRELVTTLTQRILGGEQVSSIEHRILHKNGSHRWVSNSPILRRDANGRLIGYDGIVRDITEHKRNALALQELREHQQRAGQLLTTILSNTFMGAVYLDTAFNYLWVNEAYAKNCQRPASFFPGKNLFALYPKFGNRPHFADVVKSGEPYFGSAVPLDFVDQPERGTTYWDYSLFPITDGTHSIVGLVLTVAEVTARVRMEEQLRASELRYRTVANYTHDWEYWETPNGKLAYCSPSCLRVTGHHPEEFLNDPSLLESLIHVDDQKTWQRFRKEVALSRSLREIDFRIIKPDGTSTWLSQRCAPVIAEDGTHLGWRASTRDIADRKRSELQLKTQADLLNLCPVCITVHDEQGRFSYANQKALDLHGYTREEFFALSLPQLQTADTAALFHEHMHALRREGTIGVQTQHCNKQGNVFTLWTDARATVLDGKLVVLNVASDITDRVRAVTALAESESTLRAVFEAVNDLVLVVEPDGTVVTGNTVAATRFELTVEELQKRNLFELVDEETTEARRRHFASVLQSATAVRFEDSRAGRYLEHSLFPITDTNGKVARVAIFSRDTTERRQAEDRLRRTNARLLSLREAQSQFMTTGDPQPVYRNLLDALVELSQSEFGCLEKTSTFESEAPLSTVNFDQRDGTQDLHVRLAPKLRALRDDALAQGGWSANAPVRTVSSGAATGELDAGSTVRSFIGIPLVYGGEVVGIVGLANRPHGYSSELVDQLAPFTSTCASTIHAVETMRLYREQGALLRASEETKRAITETVPGIVYRVALFPKWKLVHVSAGVLRLTGFTPEEIDSPSFDLNRLIPAEEAARLVEAVNLACQSGQPGELDVRLTNKAGRVCWVHVRGQVTRGAAGRAEFIDGVAIEISARKRAEDALAAKTQELERYFTSALDLLCIADTNGNFRRLNPSWSTTLGYPLEQLEGSSFLDFVHPDDLASTRQAVAQLSEQTAVNSFTNRYRHADGSYRYIEWRAQPQGDLIYAAARDVTDQRLAENALRESESRFRTLVENTPDIITQFDTSGRALYVNPSVMLFGGITPESLIGKTYLEAGFPEEQGRLWQARIARVLSSGRPDEAEINLESERRGTVVLNWRLLPVFGPDGVGSVLSLARDITEQKRLEREYQALFNEMLSGLVVLEVLADSAGHATDHRVLAANPAFERLTGLAAEDIQGRTLLEILPSTDRRWIELFGQVALSGTPAHFEAHFIDLERLFEITAFRTAPRQLACIFVDISERRLLQEQYHQSNKLEAIGRLATGVAHDLNNLMMPILGYSDALLEMLEPQAAIINSVKEIRAAGLQAKDLVRQLLAFGRKQQLEFRHLDLNGLLLSFAKLLERALRENIRLTLKPSPVPLWVSADVGQLELVLMNLAVTAQDSMPSGGSLTIELAPNLFRGSLPPMANNTRPDALLIVRDDGQGMDPETRERIFEPCFSTLSSNRSEGLGLATVHRIIVEHGGTISVQSDPGRGSEFIIRLPAATGDIKDTSESNTPPSVAQPRAQGSILVVEDNPLVRDLTVRALEGQGYCVRSAADAKECLAALPGWNQAFDLLLTDVVMPDMNGKALYEVLAARYGQLKVVYMSGYSQEFISQQHQIDSDAAFLQKPFSMRRLIATVRHAFAK